MSFETVALSADGFDDWLLRPVRAGMCRFESLKDGTIDLADIAWMNDALAVAGENDARAQAAAQKAAER